MERDDAFISDAELDVPRMTPLREAPVTEISNLARLFKCVLPTLFPALSVLEKDLDLGLGRSPSLFVVALARSFIHAKLENQFFSGSKEGMVQA